jgi:hypothetical protein
MLLFLELDVLLAILIVKTVNAHQMEQAIVILENAKLDLDLTHHINVWLAQQTANHALLMELELVIQICAMLVSI